MARHIFSFAGGGYLTTLGAVWFVSYSYYKNIDKTHINWEKVSTCPARISTFNNTTHFHKYWLEQIDNMNNVNLSKNTIGINPKRIKNMAKELLNIWGRKGD